MKTLSRCKRCKGAYDPERVTSRGVLRLTYCGTLCQVADGYYEQDWLESQHEGAAEGEKAQAVPGVVESAFVTSSGSWRAS